MNGQEAIKRLRWYVLDFLPAMVFTIFLLFISMSRHPIGGYGVETDFYWDYAPAADLFLQGELPIERLLYRGPGYPLVLALFTSLVGDTFTAGKIISSLAAGTVLFIFQKLLLIRFGLAWSLIGTLALAFNGVFFEYAVRAGTDMFFIMLCMIIIFILGTKSTPFRLGVAGFIAGWAYITRYNGISLLLLLIFWIILSMVKREPNHRQNVRAVFVSAIIPILSWIVVLIISTGSPFPNHNIHNVLYETEAIGRIGWEEYWYSPAADDADEFLDYPTIRAISFSAVKNIVDNLIGDAELLVGNWVLITALAGLVVLLLGKAKPGVWSWGIMLALLNYLILLFVFHSVRFSLVLAPTYILLAILFFEWTREKLAPLTAHSRIYVFLVAVIIFFPGSSPLTWSEAIARIEQSPKHFLEFVELPEVSALTPGRMAARKPHVPYLLDMQFVALPILEDRQAYVEWMRAEKIDYLFLSSHASARRPVLAGLLGSQRDLTGFELIAFREVAPKAGIWRTKRMD